MASVETLKVKIVDRNAKTTEGEVRRQAWDKKERTSRAIRTLGACWAGAIVAIIFPIIHFVLVPGLFIGGIVAAFVISSKTSIVLGGEGFCPTCGKPLQIVRTADVWPLSDMCSECQMMVTIEKA